MSQLFIDNGMGLKMRQVSVVLFGLAVVLAAAFYGLSLKSKGAADNSASVPLGASVVVSVEQEDGEIENWKLKKTYVPREKLPDLVLPQPEEDSSEQNGVQSQLAKNATESWRTGNIREAIEIFDQAIKENPDDVSALSSYGRLLTMMSAKSEALPHLERAAELTPNDPQVWLDLATLYERSILLERALYAKETAEKLANGRTIFRNQRGFWVLDGVTFP